jgi:hypothetical protein
MLSVSDSDVSNILIQQQHCTFMLYTKPPVWGGQGPYKDCRATDDDDDDDDP